MQEQNMRENSKEKLNKLNNNLNIAQTYKKQTQDETLSTTCNFLPHLSTLYTYWKAFI